MRHDEVRRLLTAANPWWRAAANGSDQTAWAGDHRLLTDRARYDLGYRSDVLADITERPVVDLMIVLTGPRRIGRSVALLDCAARLCARPDVHPLQVVHLACDGMQDRDLRRSLTLGRDVTRSVDRPTVRRRVWLLDEVSDVPNWTAVLKAARDGTAFGNDTVVATGSRWVDGPQVVTRLLAGRAGRGQARRVRHLLPMTFRDFLVATRPDLPRLPDAHPARLQHADVAEQLVRLQFEVDAFDLAWQAYLTCGGFPRAVAEYARTGQVSLSFMRDVAAWLRSDVDPEGPADSVPLLLDGLISRVTSPLSIARTAGTLGFSSRAALHQRINRLISSFAALSCPQRDDAARPVTGSQAKLYLTDPILAQLGPLLRAGLASPDMTALTECMLGVALARSIDDLQEGRWSSNDTIGYSRSGSGNEVDLAPVPVPTAAGTESTTPIEGKWVDSGWRNAAKALDARYQRGVLATKSVLDVDGRVWAVPAPLVALLLQ